MGTVMNERLQRYTRTVFGNFEAFNKGAYVKFIEAHEALEVRDAKIEELEESLRESDEKAVGLWASTSNYKSLEAKLAYYDKVIQEQEALRVDLTERNKKLDKEAKFDRSARDSAMEALGDSDRERFLLWLLIFVEVVSWFF